MARGMRASATRIRQDRMSRLHGLLARCALAQSFPRSAHRAPVAQLDRALVSGTRGRAFKSPRARHFNHGFIYLGRVVFLLGAYVRGPCSKTAVLWRWGSKSMLPHKSPLNSGVAAAPTETITTNATKPGSS
jgi:hypothetical protein